MGTSKKSYNILTFFLVPAIVKKVDAIFRAFEQKIIALEKESSNLKFTTTQTFIPIVPCVFSIFDLRWGTHECISWKWMSLNTP